MTDVNKTDEVRAAGAWLGMGDGTLYGDLKPGDTFRFKEGGTLTKVRGSWYKDEAGNRWQTGRLTAVHRVHATVEG